MTPNEALKYGTCNKQRYHGEENPFPIDKHIKQHDKGLLDACFTFFGKRGEEEDCN